MKLTFCIVQIVIIVTITYVQPSHANSWLGFHKPAFHGKIIDVDTKEPIEGVVVVAAYNEIIVPWLPDSISKSFYARETLTDKNGIFNIPSYTTLINPLSVSYLTSIIIVKPGYDKYYACCQTYNAGLRLADAEDFFSEDFGKQREMELGVRENYKTKWIKYNVTYGVVQFKRQTTPTDIDTVSLFNYFKNDFTAKQLPLLFKALEKQKEMNKEYNQTELSQKKFNNRSKIPIVGVPPSQGPPKVPRKIDQ